MHRILVFAVLLVAFQPSGFAQPMPRGPEPAAKPNANPCSDEVAASLEKLRKSSWFRMNTRMITENGPMTMQVDYVLPDRMHQTVTELATQKTSEVILVGDDAWSQQGLEGWKPLPVQVAGQLKGQMQESVLEQQKEVGSYACKGRTQVEGRDVFSYKLESEAEKGKPADENQAFRMFYVDAMTGLPVSNALLVPGHEEKPIFKTTYEFPLDLRIEPPADIVKDAVAPAAPAAPASK